MLECCDVGIAAVPWRILCGEVVNASNRGVDALATVVGEILTERGVDSKVGK